MGQCYLRSGNHDGNFAWLEGDDYMINIDSKKYENLKLDNIDFTMVMKIYDELPKVMLITHKEYDVRKLNKEDSKWIF